MNNTINNGIIIAFDGLDCSFKETNCNAFVNKLKKTTNNPIITESFPRYNCESCNGVKKWLNDKFDRETLKKYPQAINSMYAFDRMCYWYEKEDDNSIPRINNIDNNSIFVFDRYTTTNAIYNPMDNMSIDEDFTFDTKVFGIPMPNIVVWMRMRSFDVLKDLIMKKKNKDKNEMDIEFLRKIWLRSEFYITSNVYSQVGIKLVTIECLNDDNTIRTKEELEKEIFDKLIKEINHIII